MGEKWERQLKQELERGLDKISWDKVQEKEILEGIHEGLHQRREHMKFSKKRMIPVFATAVLLVGSITAAAAGKITFLTSSVDTRDAISSVQELEKEAKKKIDGDIKLVETLSDGSAYGDGFLMEMEEQDAEGNILASYPEVNARYGDIMLSIIKGYASEEERMPDKEEEYQGYRIVAYQDAYLFLPEEGNESEEDLKLEAEGKLFISYGSSEEERKEYKYISWKDGELEYSLSTFSDKTLEEMMEMAKQYIDA